MNGSCADVKPCTDAAGKRIANQMNRTTQEAADEWARRLFVKKGTATAMPFFQAYNATQKRLFCKP
jgi:TorA maturation chaperone TorD